MVCLPEAILDLLSAGLKSEKRSVSYTHFSVHNFGDLEAMRRRTGRGESSMLYLPQHSQMMCMVWRDPLLLPNVDRPRLLEPSFLCGFIQ